MGHVDVLELIESDVAWEFLPVTFDVSFRLKLFVLCTSPFTNIKVFLQCFSDLLHQMSNRQIKLAFFFSQSKLLRKLRFLLPIVLLVLQINPFRPPVIFFLLRSSFVGINLIGLKLLGVFRPDLHDQVDRMGVG